MKVQRAQTAEHRPPVRRRRARHDDVVAGDLFSGFGGLTAGMEAAGITTILAANHNRYKVQVHEANHPGAEHWVCDLVDPDAGDYHSPRDLPRVDWLATGISCVHHSGANAKRAYAEGQSLFTFEDPEWEERVTRSERDRATAICVLQYADIHHPRVIVIECTTELTSWGPALPGKRTIGDGTTYRWWLGEMRKLGYRGKTLYLNSMFFGVPQSRDRIYLCFWGESLSDPDLDHRPPAWCARCDREVDAEWRWRTGVPPSGRVRWGEQYDYRCPSCGTAVVPPRAPAINALDLTDLGSRIGDRKRPLAEASMARVRRCVARFKDFPAVLMPAKAVRGVDRHPWVPMGTQTSQQETALVSTGAVMVAAGNTFERPGSECRTRTLAEPLWTQHATPAHGLVVAPTAVVVPYRAGNRATHLCEPLATQGSREAFALLSAGVVPYRRHTVPTMHAEPMPTQVGNQVAAVLSAGVINANGNAAEAKYRSHPVTDPFTGFTACPTHTLLAAGAPSVAEWRGMLGGLTPEDCFYRMMFAHEVRSGCGFADDFIVWGTAREQIDGYGNAVSPPVAKWISLRLKEIL